MDSPPEREVNSQAEAQPDVQLEDQAAGLVETKDDPPPAAVLRAESKADALPAAAAAADVKAEVEGDVPAAAADVKAEGEGDVPAAAAAAAAAAADVKAESKADVLPAAAAAADVKAEVEGDVPAAAAVVKAEGKADVVPAAGKEVDVEVDVQAAGAAGKTAEDPELKQSEAASDKTPKNNISQQLSNFFSSFSKKEKKAAPVHGSLESSAEEESESDKKASELPPAPEATSETKPEVAPTPSKEETATLKEDDTSGLDDGLKSEDVSGAVNLGSTDLKAETKEMAPSALEVHASCDKAAADPEPAGIVEVPGTEDVAATASAPEKDPIDEGLFFNSPAAIAAALFPSQEAGSVSRKKSQAHIETESDSVLQPGAAATSTEQSSGTEKSKDSSQPRKSGTFLENIFGFGSRPSSKKQEVATKEQESPVDTAEVGYGLTKNDILDLNERLDAALKEDGRSITTTFKKTLDEFSDPVEYFLEMEASFAIDESAPGIIESLSLDLGDEHPLVTELKRRHNLEQIKQVDAYVQESLDKKEEGLSKTIFTEKPEEYGTSTEYYIDLEKKAADMGHTLVPPLTDKLGDDHPIVRVLSEAKPTLVDTAEEVKDEFVDVELTKTSAQELPVSEGGVLSGSGVNEPESGKQTSSQIVHDETDAPASFCRFCICLRA